jgi:hypothetical protein
LGKRHTNATPDASTKRQILKRSDEPIPLFAPDSRLESESL